MAVAPATYVLRPTTAHAAICNCQGLQCDCRDGCCDGYTDFCCFLTGENLCPPGTIVAGWWKADGSGFCDIGGPRPRYYLDCNLPCDDSCGCNGSGVCKSECTSADCRCAGGDCHSRSVDCTRFRYGQCNQDVPCLGPIACRIVTCVPPWDWDHSCTTEVATDNQTALHDRPCLHQGFTDVAPDSWYTEPVLWMAEQGITTGFTADLLGRANCDSCAHRCLPLALLRPPYSCGAECVLRCVSRCVLQPGGCVDVRAEHHPWNVGQYVFARPRGHSG